VYLCKQWSPCGNLVAMAHHTPPRGKLRVILLARISKEKEEGTDTSIPTQVAIGTAYVNTKPGWELVKVITEEGVSGFKENVSRPKLEQALRMIETGQADVLLVWKLDRLTRSLLRFMGYWGRIQKAGGEFASVVESFDTTTTMGKLMLLIVATFAEMESEMKRDRALPWHEHRREQGLPVGGPRPYGYLRSKNALTVIDEEAAVIRDMAEAVLEGETLSHIAGRLIAAGIHGPYVDKQGQPVNLTVKGIKGILTGPTVAGLRKNLDGTFVPAQWTAILERDEWEQVRTVLHDPARRTNFADGKPAYLLTGFAECSECHVKLTRKNHPKGLRLLCRKCNSSLPMKVADDAATLWLMDNIDAQAWQNLKEQGRGFDPEVVAALEAEKSEIAQMKADGDIDLAQFKILNRDLNARIAAAHDETPLDLPDIADLQTGWETLNLADQRSVIQTLLETVAISQHSSDCQGRDRVMIERAI